MADQPLIVLIAGLLKRKIRYSHVFRYLVLALVAYAGYRAVFPCKTTSEPLSVKDARIYKNSDETILLSAVRKELNFLKNNSYFDTNSLIEGGRETQVAFDPRVMPALLLQKMTSELKAGDLSWKFSIGFLWTEWLDWSDFQSLECPDMSSRQLFYDKLLTSAERKCLGTWYMIYKSPPPERIALIGVGKTQDNTLIVPTFKGSFQPYRTRGIISLKDELSDFNDNWKVDVTYTDDMSLKYDIFRKVQLDIWETTELSPKEFTINYNKYVSTLTRRVEKSVALSFVNDFDRRLLDSLRSSLFLNNKYPKYFHEAILNDKRGHHFDWRFFKKVTYLHYEKRAILHRLSRAWLRFAKSLGLKTWLAHGTLLGWHWNAMTMPWDPDMDVQMTFQSLLHLARNYNQTLVVDVLGTGHTYLMDVGPSFFHRTRLNGLNTIDARFIDTATGFYVDITALAFTGRASSSERRKWPNHEVDEFNQVLVPEYRHLRDSQTISIEDVEKQIELMREDLIESEELYQCRNQHFYLLQELTLLQKTYFEGVAALVPREYKQILHREYRHGVYSQEHERHRYRPVLDMWVPVSICKGDVTGAQCQDENVLMEAEDVRTVTRRRRNEKERKLYEEGDLKRVYVDEWELKKAKEIIEKSRIIIKEKSSQIANM